MLSIKEIAEKFDIPKTTLYGWKNDRPKVYDYLVNSDEQYEEYRDINIFLETYIKTDKNITVFEYKEIEYVFALELELQDLKTIENLHLTYINASMKKEKESGEFTLDIYKKLESLKKEEKEELLRHYFKEFLLNSVKSTE
ncbi:MAG: hypothetical protein COB17_08665 [Sulfurimonas sp.]|nr:MAG: hypothetical protein COB17_08665 [Sulfurimonas sp.]